MNTTNTEHRIIHTGLFSKKALEILKSVDGQLSDGMWENSPRMDRYWRFSHMLTAPNGEVLIQISTKSGISEQAYYGGRGQRWIENGFHQMSDEAVKKWYADKAKHVIKTELKDEKEQDQSNDITSKYYWDRNNTEFKTVYLSYDEAITVSDVYLVYEFLSGRPVIGKYSTEHISEMTVQKMTDEQIKAEEERRAKVDELENKMYADLKALNDWKAAEIAKIQAEAGKKSKEIRENYFKTVNEVYKPAA